MLDPLSNGGYSHQQSKWVPVAAAAISPDGSRYAYAEPAVAAPGPPQPDVIHVITVATGADHPVRAPGPATVVAFTAGGIYLNAIIPQSGAPPMGLSVINPDTGAVHQVIAGPLWWRFVSDTAAYAIDVDPADPNPPQSTNPGPALGDRIEKLDLTTGTFSPLLTVNGSSVFVEGLAGDQNPIVAISNASGLRVRLVPTNQEIFSGPALDPSGHDSDPISALADATGIWFASGNGVVWHFGTGDSALRQAAVTSVQFPSIAGTCS